MKSPKNVFILGISAFYHDSAAALIWGPQIIAAAQEERFSRRKNDPNFPSQAIAWSLKFAGISPAQLSAVVFYDKPITKFTRLLESYLSVAPKGWHQFITIMPEWLSYKLNLKKTIHRYLPGLPQSCPILFSQHHQAHAASAFYPSPFYRAAILTIDGVGEWATTTICHGVGPNIKPLKEIRFPHSLGLLYSAFTAYCGFKINSGEYKLMGLAPYGEAKYVNKIYEELIDLKEDGSFKLNLDYFAFLTGTTMTNEKFNKLFGGPPRLPDQPLHQRYADVAASIQKVCEEIMLRLARHAKELTGERFLTMAGGVALNCVATGKILRSGLFEKIWIQPAAGDAGGALGAALAVWYEYFNSLREESTLTDQMQGALLGPEFSDQNIYDILKSFGAKFVKLEPHHLIDQVVEDLLAGKVVGWFQGRMEFGPRALGARSILADPRREDMQAIVNQKIKLREPFRPFAPAVLLEDVGNYFELNEPSPYMLIVAPIREELRKPLPAGAKGLELIHSVRSSLPAITHVDYSARIQTVGPEAHPLFRQLLQRWKERTGCGVLLNTSFNIRGEPIVCSPKEAYECFIRTEMDSLAIGSFFLRKEEQPSLPYQLVMPEPD